MITKATADGTLNTRNWDMEPLFPMPDADVVNKEYDFSYFTSCFCWLKYHSCT